MKSQKACFIFFLASFLGAIHSEAVVKDAAFLQGSSLANGENALTSATPIAIAWTERSSIDPNTYEHSFVESGRLVVKKAGDYLVAATMPITAISDADNRPSQAIEIYVNDQAVPGTVGATGYIRNQPRNVNMQNETSCHSHALLVGLESGDVIEVRAWKTAQPVLATALTSASLFVEFIDPTRSCFSALSDESTNDANLNPSFEEEGDDPFQLSWESIRKDSDFTHSDGSSEIRLDAGTYVLFVNVPLQASIQRGAPGLEVLLDGNLVKGGTARQGYNRNASGHNESSLHWSGMIQVSGNQTLTLQTFRLAMAGEVKIMDGRQASVFLEKIDEAGVHFTSASEVDNEDPINWNPIDKSSLSWNSADLSDATFYNQGANNLTIREGGSYLLIYQDTLQSIVQRPNPRITIEVNGETIAGAETKTHYIRSADGHNEASGSLVFLLEDLSANDEITVSTQREGNAGEVFIDEFQNEGAIFSLIKKESIEASSIVSSPRIRFFDGGIEGFDVHIQNFATGVNEDSIQTILDGTAVDVEIITSEGITSIAYSFPEIPESLSEHEVILRFEDSEGVAQEVAFPFVVDTIYARIPPAFSASGVDTESSGFIAHISQISTAQSGAGSLHGNTASGAEAQLAGTFLNEFDEPYLNEAGPFSANDFVIEPFEIEAVINFDQAAGITGNFNDNNGFADDFIPNIPGFEDSDDGIVAEFLTFLELDSGFYTLGVNSDDGFRVSTGPSLKDQAAIELGAFNGGRAASDTLFSILVEESGIYPIRLLWYEGTGGASVEFFSVSESGEKILINDRDHPEAIRAYSQGNDRPFISDFSPRGRQLSDALEYEIHDAEVDVIQDSIRLTINGSEVSPEISKMEDITKVIFRNPDGFFPSGNHLAILSYDEGSDPILTRIFNHSFSIPKGQSIILLDNPFAYWRLGETEGNVAINEVSNDHSGTYINNPELGAERLVIGDASSSVFFDASQGHSITLANHADINDKAVNDGWAEKSIEFWFKARNLPTSDLAHPDVEISQRQVIYEQGGATRGINVYLVGTQSGPNPEEAELWFNILNRAETAWGGTVPYNEDQGFSPNDEAVAVGTTIKANTLYHAVMVFQGDEEEGGFEGGITGYLNGESFGEEIGANMLFDHTDGIAIGRRNNEVSFHDYIVNAGNGPEIFNSGDNLHYDGWLDEFALYNVALTPDQVKAHYEAGLMEVPFTMPPISEGGIVSISSNDDGSLSVIFEGSLSSSSNVIGPFSPVEGATSPFVITPNEAAQFYIAR